MKFIILALGIFQMELELVFGGIPDVGESIAFVITLRSLMLIGLILLNYGLTPSRKKNAEEKLPREVANLAYMILGENQEFDDDFWDHYVKKSKEIIDEYKEEQSKKVK